MKVLLVQSYLGRKEAFPIFPLGLCYLGTILEGKGHEIKTYDPNVALRPYEDLKGLATDFKPDVVGISLRNIDNQLRISMFYYYKHFEQTLKIIKNTCPDIRIIAGGPGFSIFSEKIMKRNPIIDYGVHLEAEESLPELLDNLNNPSSVRGIYFHRNGEIVYSGHRTLPNFKDMPIPRRDIFDITPYINNTFDISPFNYSLGIQTKRGCPLKCTYCTYPQLNGDTLRLRDADSVCDEIEHLLKLSINQFMFADAIFNIPIDHATKICNEIIKRGLKINWSAYMDIRYTSRDFLLLAKEAGCKGIIFSPDGFSQNALDRLKKGIREEDVKASLNQFLSDKELKDIHVVYSIFINPPGETLKGILKTVIFFFKAKILLHGRGTAFINWIRLEPDTEILRTALKEGVVKENTDLLPVNEKYLKKTFYSNRKLKFLDFILMGLLTITIKYPPLLKKFLK